MRAPKEFTQRIGFAAGLLFALGWLVGCQPAGPAPAAAALGQATNLMAAVKSNLAQVLAGDKTNEAATAENRSVFDGKLKDARDPFFPYAGTLAGVRPGTNGLAAAMAVLKPSPESLLELNSIVGSPSRRLASINGRTFLAGEEKTVSTSSGDVRVRCLEVVGQSVTVVINGRAEHKKLNLSKRSN